MLVEGQVLLELKALEKIAAVHEAQLVSYLRLSGCKLGLLINFHQKRLIDGIHRKVNNL
jgi:GxxExxY protein